MLRHICVYLSRLRIVRPMAKEANDSGKGASFRAGTRDWVGVSHQWHILHLWKSQGPCVAGRPNLGDSVRGAGSFSTSCISVALFFLLSSQQLQDLLRQNHVAYSSDDLLVICQALGEQKSWSSKGEEQTAYPPCSWVMCYWQLYKRGFEAGAGFAVCQYSMLSFFVIIYVIILYPHYIYR